MENTAKKIKKKRMDSKENLEKNTTWNLYKTYSKGLENLTDVEVLIKASFFSTINETNNGFELIVKNINTKKEIYSDMFNNAEFNDMDLSPSGNSLVVSMTDFKDQDPSGQMIVYDTNKWKQIFTSSEKGEIGEVAYSPDGNFLGMQVSELVKIWHSRSKKIKHVLSTPDKFNNIDIEKLIFVDKALYAICSSKDSDINQSCIINWELSGGNINRSSWSIDQRVNSGVFLENQSHLVISGQKCPIILLDIKDLIRQRKVSNTNFYVSSIVNSGSNEVIFSDYIRKPRVLNIDNDRVTHLTNSNRRVRDMEVSDNKKYLIASERKGIIKIWKKEE